MLSKFSVININNTLPNYPRFLNQLICRFLLRSRRLPGDVAGKNSRAKQRICIVALYLEQDDGGKAF